MTMRCKGGSEFAEIWYESPVRCPGCVDYAFLGAWRPVSRLTNKLNKKDQGRSGGGIGIGLLRQPFVADELPPTGEYSHVCSGTSILTPKPLS